MTDPAPSDPNDTLGALLRRPYESMSTWLYGELAARGFDDVRPAYSAVLRNLPPAGARVGELAAQAGMTKQSMAYLVAQMQAAQLVEVAADATDRRASSVRLTARGEKALATGIALSRQYEAHLVALVGARKMAALRATLREIGTSLDETPSP